MKVLYVTGTSTEGPDATTEQLTRLSPDLQIKTVTSAAQALEETRTSAGFRALLTSPWLAQNETLSLIVSLRRDRVPIAIVPVLTETQRDFFASAVAAGADDVLLLRGETLLRANETLTRIKQSPHLSAMSGERRRLRVLYAGVDDRVWHLLEQVPFVTPERGSVGAEGSCPVRVAGSATNELRCDLVIIDQQPGDVHPLQVLKSVKAQASDLPVVILAPPGAGDVETAALDLGADDTVIKSGIYRRRLIATLRRFHQRAEIVAQHTLLRAREHRLRQIVETLPQGVGIIGADLSVLAMNGVALSLFGATKPTDVVGRDFRTMVAAEQRDAVLAGLKRVAGGDTSPVAFEAVGLDGSRHPVELRGVVLERDARGGRGIAAVFSTPSAGQDPAAAGKLEAAVARVEAAAVEVRTLEQQLAETTAALTAERQARETAEQRLAEAEADVTRRSEAEASLADVLTQERSAWDEARRALEAKVTETEARRAEDARALATVRETEDELRRTADRSTEEADRHRRDAEARLSEIEDLRRSLDSLRAEADDLRRAASEAAVDLERANDARGFATAELDTLQQAHDALAAEHAQLRDAQAATGADHQALAEARASAEAARDALQAEFDRERQAWTTTRESLERELAERASALETARGQSEELDQVRRELDQARGELDHVRGERDQTRGELDHLRGERDQARGELDHLRGERDQARGELDHLRGERDQARGELDHLRGERDQARGELDHVRAEYERARGDAERLQGELDAARRDAAGAREELEARLREAEAARDQAASRLQELQSAHADHAALASELERLRGDLQQAAAARDDIDARLRAADGARQELETARQALEARALTAEHAQRDVESRLQAAEAARAELETRAHAAEAARAELETRAHSAEAARAELEARAHAAEAARAELEARAHSVNGQQAEIAQALEASRAELRQADEGHAVEREAWERRRQELEASLGDAAARAGQFEDRVRDLEAARADLERRLGDADVERGRLQAERDELAADRARLEGERVHLESERGRLEADRHRLEDAIRDAEARANGHATTIDDLRRELDALATSRHDLETRLHDAEKARTTLGQRVERLAADAGQTSELQSSIEALQAELRQLAADHAAERTTWEALRQDYERRLREDEARRQALEQDRRHDRAALEQAAAADRAAIEQKAAADRAAIEQAAAADRAAIEQAAAADREAREAAEARLAGVTASLRAAEDAVTRLEEARALEAGRREAAERARAALDARLAETADAVEARARLEATIQALRAEHAAREAELDAARRSRLQDREEIEVVRQAFDHERGRRAALREQVAELESAVDQHRASLQAEIQTRQAIEHELSVATRELRALGATSEARLETLSGELTQLRAAFTRLSGSSLFGRAVMTLDGHLETCNDTFARLFGYRDAAAALEQQSTGPFAALAGRTALDERLRADRRYDGIEVTWTRPDGRTICLRESAAIVRQADGREVVERICVDASAATRLEEDLRLARRLQEVGTLAASMAPDLEARLRSVRQAARELADTPGPHGAHRIAAETALAGAEEAATLVRQLVAFSRRQVAPPDRVDLNESVRKLEPTLRRLIGSHIVYETDLRPSGTVIQSGDDLDQLLTALVVAARDLLPVGGILRIETDRVELDAEDVHGFLHGRAGLNTVVAVSASGYGLQRAQASHAIEVLAQRCGGWLRAANESDHEASLEVYFPATSARPAE
ncbi:MAG: PAS domain S-box protein [Vicinamibacterales bacterium]